MIDAIKARELAKDEAKRQTENQYFRLCVYVEQEIYIAANSGRHDTKVRLAHDLSKIERFANLLENRQKICDWLKENGFEVKSETQIIQRNEEEYVLSISWN